MNTRYLVLILALLCAPLMAGELAYEAISVTATSTTRSYSVSTLTLVNDGANEVYVRVFDASSPPSAATDADWEIKVGEGFEISRTRGIGAISFVCEGAETATMRVIVP